MKFLKYLVFLLLVSCATTIRPTELPEFSKTSVMIVDKAQTYGGSGVILESGKNSYILTNKHICDGLLTDGGLINVLVKDKDTEQTYPVKGFKTSKNHDLCEIWVAANLHVNTVVSSAEPKQYDFVFISGHPSLYPHILSVGYLVADVDVEVMMGVRPCTKEEFQQNPPECLMNGMPITQMFKAQLTTALISGGSSGSAVFNNQGEIIGLAFATRGTSLNYALIVPWKFVHNFLNEEAPKLQWTVPKAEAPK